MERVFDKFTLRDAWEVLCPVIETKRMGGKGGKLKEKLDQKNVIFDCAGKQNARSTYSLHFRTLDILYIPAVSFLGVNLLRKEFYACYVQRTRSEEKENK